MMTNPKTKKLTIAVLATQRKTDTEETAHDDESKNEEAHRYIEHSVEKTQESSTEPKMTPSKYSPGDTLGPSTSKSTSTTVVESPTPSAKKPPTPPPNPVVAPSVFDEVMDLVSDDDNDLVSDMVNLSSKMTHLVVEDMDEEQMLQLILNMEDGFPSEEKEHQFPSFRSCDLNPGTGLVSPFETHSVSIKENYSPELRAISELAAEDTDDEQMVFHATNTDVLHSKKKECQLTRLQAGDQNKSYPSDDGINQTETDLSLHLLPISHRNSCEIKVIDAVTSLENMVSKMAISIFENNFENSFGLGKKKRPAIIVSDEEDGELIDELDEDKPDGICMSPPRTKEPMTTIGFSSHRPFVPLEETEDAATEAGTASNVSNDNSLDANCKVM